MTHVGLARTAIVIAGTATAAMGAFHFALPALFGWARFTQTLPVQIQWALVAINAFFSLLLLAGGLTSLMAVRRDASSRWSIGTMVVFWVFNAAYQVVRPFPAPRIRWVLLGFAVVVALLYIVGLILLDGFVWVRLPGRISAETGGSAGVSLQGFQRGTPGHPRVE